MLHFIPFLNLTDISDFKIEGTLDTAWDCKYMGKKPTANGSGLKLKNFKVKELNLIKNRLANNQLLKKEHFIYLDSIYSNNQLVYIVKSKKYSILYVGISERGLIKGIFGTNGRFAHHIRKIFAMPSGGGTNHTAGWRAHAIKRYKDLVSSNNGSNNIQCTHFADDIEISFGIFDDKTKVAKDYEGFVLCAAFEKFAGSKNFIQIMNTGAMSYTPIPITYL